MREKPLKANLMILPAVNRCKSAIGRICVQEISSWHGHLTSSLPRVLQYAAQRWLYFHLLCANRLCHWASVVHKCNICLNIYSSFISWKWHCELFTKCVHVCDTEVLCNQTTMMTCVAYLKFSILAYNSFWTFQIANVFANFHFYRMVSLLLKLLCCDLLYCFLHY